MRILRHGVGVEERSQRPFLIVIEGVTGGNRTLRKQAHRRQSGRAGPPVFRAKRQVEQVFCRWEAEKSAAESSGSACLPALAISH
jgi:hypothetical protein